MGRTSLSAKELSRAEVMGRVKAGSLRLREAAELLELSYRQAKRVWACSMVWRRQRKRKPYRQRRGRRAHFGELVQLDGSFHRWLEDRAGEGV